MRGTVPARERRQEAIQTGVRVLQRVFLEGFEVLEALYSHEVRAVLGQAASRGFAMWRSTNQVEPLSSFPSVQWTFDLMPGWGN